MAASNIIRSGTKVMAEFPVLMVDHGAFSHLSQELLSDLVTEAATMLPTVSQDAFFGQLKSHTVFLNVARINHTCSPNVAYYFDPVTMSTRLYAVRNIYPGAELTIGYVDLTQPSQMRQFSLSPWNFTCSCPRCTQPSHQQRESDARASQLLDIRNGLDKYNFRFQDGPQKAELLITLYELEGLEVRVHEAYYRAAIEFNGVKDKWKAVKFARLCLDRGLLLKDETRPFVVQMRSLVEDVEGHWSWGFRLGGEE
ncbi:hypothetical protein B0T21DRAFT_411787 [Apiosordaria backusii]|uniref:SET domain-containing protein n=1 Tax=Apiosordaria backusii TaxID=314023 RepID=A0AA40BM15_9PEZI|nr:hypothetical protein B0T21DRAFT_411787 [Apiosordaria backusii]